MAGIGLCRVRATGHGSHRFYFGYSDDRRAVAEAGHRLGHFLRTVPAMADPAGAGLPRAARPERWVVDARPGRQGLASAPPPCTGQRGDPAATAGNRPGRRRGRVAGGPHRRVRGPAQRGGRGHAPAGPGPLGQLWRGVRHGRAAAVRLDGRGAPAHPLTCPGEPGLAPAQPQAPGPGTGSGRHGPRRRRQDHAAPRTACGFSRPHGLRLHGNVGRRSLGRLAAPGPGRTDCEEDVPGPQGRDGRQVPPRPRPPGADGPGGLRCPAARRRGRPTRGRSVQRPRRVAGRRP